MRRIDSLGGRLLAAVAVIAVAALAIDVLMWRDLDQRLRADAVDHAVDIAEVLAGQAGIVLRQPSVDLDRAVSRLEAGQSTVDLDRYAHGSSLVVQAILLDRGGAVAAVEPPEPTLLGLDWSRQPFAAGGPGQRWSNTFLSPDRGEPGVSLAKAWSGGVLVFRLDLALLSRLAGVVTAPEGGFVSVLDSQGVVIGHTDPGKARQRENLRDLALLLPVGSPRRHAMVDWRGETGLLCRTAIEGTDWSVVVFQPARHAFAVARSGALLSAGVLLGVVALIIVLGLLLRGMLQRAIDGFAGQMRRVAAGQQPNLDRHPSEFRPLVASFTDMAAEISAREGELRRSRAEFRELVEGVDSAIVRLDADGRILYINPAGERLFGWSNAELHGRPVLGTIVPAADQGGMDLSPMVRQALSDPESLRSNTNENMTRDGRRLWMSWANRAVRDASGKLVGMLSVGTDLTQHRREEEAFRALVETMAAAAGEGLYDSVLDSLVHWLDCDTASISRLSGDRLQAIAMRTRAGPMHQVDCGPISGSPCEVVLRDGWLLVQDGLPEVFPQRPDLAQSGMRSYVGAAIAGQRAVLTCMWSAPMRQPPARLREIFGLVARRVGAEMEAEDLRLRLSHADRLDSLGRLAGGVAHDFNNQLAVILGSTELMRPRLADPRLLRHLDGIRLAAERSSALTSRLLAFARRGSIELGPVDLHALIPEVILVSERTLGPSIAMSFDPAATRAVVLGNAGLLQNALLNLAMNARDAMPDGGRLTFATADAGDCIELRVGDNGQGMPPEVQARLFEPFFTTKAAGKGNGLGLPAVYGTVTGMHGTVRVESSVGNGTMFIIRLPVQDGCAVERTPEQHAPPVPGACILVAEDEPELRRTVAEFLSGLGYEVVPAADGQAALDTFLLAPDRFSLVMLDAMMPHLGGRQTFHRMREVRPRVPVVVMTGFGVESEIEAFRAEGVPILAKPCRLDHLADAVAMELRRAAG